MQLILPEGFKEGSMEEATLVRVLRRGDWETERKGSEGSKGRDRPFHDKNATKHWE